MAKIKVLVVDDSALIRQLVTRLLEDTGEFIIIDTAKNGEEAVRKICLLRPDVVSLDLEMPVLDGLGVLRQIVHKCPLPVVMLSSQTTVGARATIQALSLGAVDFVAKPAKPGQIRSMVIELAFKLKTAARIPPDRIVSKTLAGMLDRKVLTREKKPVLSEKRAKDKIEVVVIGSSTGGPAALQVLLPSLPDNFPAAVIVVQHLPEGFSKSLAEHLNRKSRLPVEHATAGVPVIPGRVLVAPAGYDFRFQGRSGNVSIRLEIGSNKQRSAGEFCPSVDKVMISAAEICGPKAMGVLLTGMGRDGAIGMSAIYQKGGPTIAEDESTCVIFGMPRAAIEAGVVQKVLPLKDIPGEITKTVCG